MNDYPNPMHFQILLFRIILVSKLNILLEAVISSMLTYSSITELHHNTASESGAVSKLRKNLSRVDDSVTGSKRGLLLPDLLQQLSQ